MHASTAVLIYAGSAAAPSVTGRRLAARCCKFGDYGKAEVAGCELCKASYTEVLHKTHEQKIIVGGGDALSSYGLHHRVLRARVPKVRPTQSTRAPGSLPS